MTSKAAWRCNLAALALFLGALSVTAATGGRPDDVAVFVVGILCGGSWGVWAVSLLSERVGD